MALIVGVLISLAIATRQVHCVHAHQRMRASFAFESHFFRAGAVESSYNTTVCHRVKRPVESVSPQRRSVLTCCHQPTILR